MSQPAKSDLNTAYEIGYCSGPTCIAQTIIRPVTKEQAERLSRLLNNYFRLTPSGINGLAYYIARDGEIGRNNRTRYITPLEAIDELKPLGDGQGLIAGLHALVDMLPQDRQPYYYDLIRQELYHELGKPTS